MTVVVSNQPTIELKINGDPKAVDRFVKVFVNDMQESLQTLDNS